MSTPQTDAHHERQQTIYENFCQHIDEHGIASAKMELRSLYRTDGIDAATLKKCEERLAKAEMESRETVTQMDEGDPNDEFREHQAREEESRAAQMDEHFAPSEGPRT